jgi:hypothetical protein
MPLSEQEQEQEQEREQEQTLLFELGQGLQHVAPPALSQRPACTVPTGLSG